MSNLDDSFLSKACEIFDVDMDSSLFSSTDSSLFSSTDTEGDYDSDETYCSEAEEQLSKENTRRIPAERPRDVQDKTDSFEELWACLVRVNCQPTLDEFATCFKYFKKSTLVELKLKLKEHFTQDKEDSRKLQEEREWYKNFKLTDEEREDSLRQLREISEKYKQF